MENNLTVAICAYNATKYIGQTLEAIAAQTFQQFDLLIVNDCSTDDTLEVVESKLKGTNFKYSIVNLEKNRGAAYSRQKALERATTKYIIFIDADDLPLPTLLEQEYNLIIGDSDIIAVSSWSKFIDENSDLIGGGLFVGVKSREEFEYKAREGKLIFLPIQTLMCRESALRVGGFRLDGFPEGKPRYQDYCEDLDLWTRMSDLYVEEKYIISIPKVLYLYRKSNSGLSSNAIYMTLKMRYVKQNLKLRRADKSEISYVEFLGSVSDDDLKKLETEAKSGYYLRNGVMKLRKLSLILGVYYIIKSFTISPKYFWQKVKANSGFFILQIYRNDPR
ncbi:MAG: glycosyltransferase family 2 protein [Rikenellaceae bacterium]